MTHSDKARKWYLHFTLFQRRVYISIPEVTGILGDGHDNLTYLRTTIGASLYGHVESGSIVSHPNETEAGAISFADLLQKLSDIITANI